MNKNDIQDCHRLGKADPKNTIVWFFNHKFGYKTLDKKLNLKEVDIAKLGFHCSLF